MTETRAQIRRRRVAARRTWPHKFVRFQLVPQRRPDDCGVCCVATIAHVTYDEALFWCIPDAVKRDRDRTTSTRDLAEALTALGCVVDGRLTRNPTGDFKVIPAGSIVRYGVPGQRHWHWVVWDGRSVIDPAKAKLPPWRFMIECPWTVHGARPTSYLKVHSCPPMTTSSTRRSGTKSG